MKIFKSNLCTFYFLCVCHVLFSQPDWSINPANFQNSMSIVAIAVEDCDQRFNASDLLAVFDENDQIRGVQSGSTVGFYFLTAYSNNGGEMLSFKYYDSDADNVYNIEDLTVTFISDVLVGDPINPITIDYDVDPSSSFAGPDQSIEGNTTNLQATGVGEWEILSGIGGVIDDIYNPVSLFTGLDNTSYTLQWTRVSVGLCAGQSDAVVIDLMTACTEQINLPCDDGDPCTIDDVYNETCDCVGQPPPDSDNDGTDDCLDACPFDPHKISPGFCGCRNVDIDINMNGVCDGLEEICLLLNHENFENDLGIWNTTSSASEDSKRVMSAHSPEGLYSIRIRDNSFEESSTFTNVLDFSQAEKVELSFSFKTIGFSNPQSFFLEISIDNGASYLVVKEWVEGIDFSNDVVAEETVVIENQVMSPTTILRFRSNGNINADEMYLDEIDISTCYQACLDYRIVYDQQVNSESLQAAIGIESNRTISDEQVVTYAAGEYILLSNGFELSSGAELNAIIQSCGL